MKRRIVLKPFVMPCIYVAVTGILLLNMITSIQKVNVGDYVYKYVSPVVLLKDVPVVSTQLMIVKPYVDENVQIKRNFYDFSATEEIQNNSIIYYENTYIQNSGVDYFGENPFTVVSILPGTVIKVSKNELTGNTVEVKHDNNLISIYQGISDVEVSEGDSLVQSQTIGISGTSKINNNEGNNLHFELFHNGQVVNPETYYNKSVSGL